MEKIKAYYAVKVGKKPGIYTTTEEVQQQITGYSGAYFRKFKTIDEAEVFMKQADFSTREIGKKTSQDKQPQETKAIEEFKKTLGKARKISLPDHWENYFACILLHMLLPLLPIIIELIINKKIKQESLTLTASMYAITVGISSKSKSQFGLGMIISLIFAICYGADIHGVAAAQMVQEHSSPIISLSTLALIAIGLTFAFHVIERYNRHIIDRDSFFNFKYEGHE